jgi:hypothetical protein
MGNRLVEHRKAVARRTFGGAGDHRQRVVGRNAFLGADDP